MTETPVHQGSILAWLHRVPVLDRVIATLGADAIARLEQEVEHFGLAGGDTLFRQGELGADLYVLINGRLGVTVDRGMGGRLVHRVLPGEMVGEMSMISHEPRTASITAIRDSEVLRIPGPLAKDLLAPSPPFIEFLLAQLVERLKTTTLQAKVEVAVETLTIMPLDQTEVGDEVVRLIAKAFEALPQPTEVVTGAHADTPVVREGALRILISRRRDAACSRHSLRQADRVLFVALRGSVPDAPAREMIEALTRASRSSDLMIVNPDDAVQPAGATEWLGLFAPDQIFNIRAGSSEDHRRVARLVTGQAIGVALAGGGARGFAHIGALRALGEAGIPIDMVGGTSMGALVGGCFAHDLDLVEVERKVRFSLVENRPIGDYTLPVVALSRGRRMTAILRRHFGEARIENSWRNFFCVSSNLTTGNAHVHRDGRMWRALRASASLPGIVPPVIENGEVLVDGAMMNNFPVDVMAALARGRVIGIDVSAGVDFRSQVEDLESRSLMRMVGRGRHETPNIVQLLTRSGLVASGQRSEANRRAADLLIQPELGSIGLLSLDRWQEAIEAGYRGTKRALDLLPAPFF